MENVFKLGKIKDIYRDSLSMQKLLYTIEYCL